MRLLFLLCLCFLVVGRPGRLTAVPEVTQPKRALGKPLLVQVKDEPPLQLYQESHALVIGNADYRFWPKLEGVVEDVRAIRQLLEKAGFAVEVQTDLTGAAFQKAFRDFIQKNGRGFDSRLLIYYAGHGETRKLAYGGNMGYIVPIDAPNPNRDETGFKNLAISMEQMQTFAREVESKHVLFVFDSCFSGSLFDLSRSIPPAITAKTNRPVRQFLTSGGADQEVPDKSIFRTQFEEALQGEADANQDSYVTASELAEFIINKVTNYSRGAQTPQFGKIRDPHLDKGDFVFEVIMNAETPTPTPVVASSLQEGKPSPPTLPDRPAEEVVRQRWKGWQEGMDESYVQLQKLTGEEYVKMGEEFLGRFAEDNPYSAEDSRMREEVRSKIAFASENKAAMPPPAEAARQFELGRGCQLAVSWIPPGQFFMGSVASEIGRDPDEERTAMTMSRGFWMGIHEVTQEQWRTVMGGQPSYFRKVGKSAPVEKVSWAEAVAFCEKLNDLLSQNGKLPDGYRFDLPTEAEWEYACRAGTLGEFAGDLETMGWYAGNSQQSTHPVAQKSPNAWGLYDMHGNVWEWCRDWYKGFSGESSDELVNPGSESHRVARGGSWQDEKQFCRSANRRWVDPELKLNYLGFRVVLRSLEQR